MNRLVVLLLAVATLVGLTACLPSAQPDRLAPAQSIALESPQPAITAPIVDLTYTEVTVTTSPALAPVECMEDDPCWDCATMGNGICGTSPVPTALTREFVTAYPIYYSPYATCPVGTAMAMDNHCLPLHYWDLENTQG